RRADAARGVLVSILTRREAECDPLQPPAPARGLRFNPHSARGRVRPGLRYDAADPTSFQSSLGARPSATSHVIPVSAHANLFQSSLGARPSATSHTRAVT